MSINQELGRAIENIAIKYLKEKNITILEHSYRYKRLEIDIIAKDKNTLIFAEVKGRTSQHFAYPEHAVNYKKRGLICTAATNYIKMNWQGDIRFDVISIIKQEQEYVINHFLDAFYYRK
jgi:putative endonuclease